MTQPEPLLTNGYTPRMVQAGLKLARMAAANRKKRAERFSERARKGWATRRARG